MQWQCVECQVHGKGEFANIIAANGVPVRSMGDMIRHRSKISRNKRGSTIYGEVAADLGEIW